MAWDAVPPCLTCPVCSERLVAGGPPARSICCRRGHSFDVARDGYVHLLTRQDQSRPTGDTRPMLLARRRFLGHGYFRHISEAVNVAVGRYLDGLAKNLNHGPCVLDAGCGDGYYLDQLARHLAHDDHHDRSVESTGEAARTWYVGVDAAKDAARLTAKRNAGVHAVVANIWDRLPCADASIQVLVNVFSPRNPAEFGRVMAPGGLLLVLIPTNAHLAEVRRDRRILAIQSDKEDRVRLQFSTAFRFDSAATVEYEVALDGPALGDLLLMSPAARHLSNATREEITRQRHVTRVTVSVRLLAFRHLSRLPSRRTTNSAL